MQTQVFPTFTRTTSVASILSDDGGAQPCPEPGGSSARPTASAKKTKTLMTQPPPKLKKHKAKAQQSKSAFGSNRRVARRDSESSADVEMADEPSPDTPKSDFSAEERRDGGMEVDSTTTTSCSKASSLHVGLDKRGWRTSSLIPALPALPPLEHVKANPLTYRGCTDEANWLLKGHLMVGAYPGSVDDRLHERQISNILNEGIRTFVCLQREYDAHASVKQWRSGQRIRPYLNDAVEILRMGHEAASAAKAASAFSRPLAAPAIPSSPSSDSSSSTISSLDQEISFVHCPIVDCDTTSDKIIVDLATNMLRRLDVGECLYCHCWGGHGRAGTVCSILLGLLYGLNGHEAMEYVQTLHDTRRYHLNTPSPQTMKQRAQVIRILRRFYAQKE